MRLVAEKQSAPAQNPCRPDWNAATLLRRADLGPGVAQVTLGIECSRERVPLRNAYVAAGQLARVRVNSGEERLLPVASGPPGVLHNKEVGRAAAWGFAGGRMRLHGAAWSAMRLLGGRACVRMRDAGQQRRGVFQRARGVAALLHRI